MKQKNSSKFQASLKKRHAHSEQSGSDIKDNSEESEVDKQALEYLFGIYYWNNCYLCFGFNFTFYFSKKFNVSSFRK